MNFVSFLIKPAMIGLLAGVGHGVISHRANLPMSLPDQVMSVIAPETLPTEL
ncbi:hypothetical protein [Lyngbya confervoides]|uniref:Uncharacterized protein n=1 Tax=Lyngbya confervoides BDU141951 TaxID=1574623 RepID=A0ABD4T4G7_9CYAN|nr:hypothetical protein [Lyngbya confervoides]MCM1983323.1 hypothetical protein [Lyngbya confervoides BDU141951]